VAIDVGNMMMKRLADPQRHFGCHTALLPIVIVFGYLSTHRWRLIGVFACILD
jgi:hypothetical protein